MRKTEREEEKKLYPGRRRRGPSFVDCQRKEGTGREEEEAHSNFSATAVKFQNNSFLASGGPPKSR